MFMIATAILTAKDPKLFLIDEPHAFLHPAAERHLLRLMQDHSEHQYIVATHSPVFLNSLPLRSARLITISDTGSQINSVQEAAEILESVGITAADLWSADNLLWVEGPSDVSMIKRLIAIHGGLSANLCRIVSMPNWIRSASSSASRAEEMVKFCESVRETILPAKVHCLFLFDGDEKRQELREQIKIATAGHARFLPVRELENLLLVPAAIHATLSAICEALDLKPPSIEQITDDLDQALNDTKNRMLYKVSVAGPDRTRVVGSEVLSLLWRKWALAEYDKVADGPDLLEQVYRLESTSLNPLVEILMELQNSPNQQG
jgi:predicted ATP-dependent endonuclease of OLD family